MVDKTYKARIRSGQVVNIFSQKNMRLADGGSGDKCGILETLSSTEPCPKPVAPKKEK